MNFHPISQDVEPIVSHNFDVKLAFCSKRMLDLNSAYIDVLLLGLQPYVMYHGLYRLLFSIDNNTILYYYQLENCNKNLTIFTSKL